MKFLDRFKRKAPAEPPLPKSHRPPEKPQSPDAAGKAAPKGTDKSNPSTASTPVAVPQKPPAGENDLRLELGDFLHRIPAHLLLPGPHDLKAELRFDIAELSSKIERGQTTIPLSDIYVRVPSVFRGTILVTDNIEVRFPWQKLAKLVNISKLPRKAPEPGSTSPELAEKLRAKKGAKSGEAEGVTTPAVQSPPPAAKPTPPTPKPAPEVKAAGTATPPQSADLSSAQPPPFAMKLESPAPLRMPAPAPAKAQEPAGPKSTPDDLKIADLPAEVQKRFALIKGEYERQIAELQLQRKGITEARDRAAMEVERLKKEIDKNLVQLAKEQTASTFGQQLAQRHEKEREELVGKINKLEAELEKSSANDITGETSGTGDKQVVALKVERDMLLAEIARLSAQIADLTARRAIPAAGATSGHAQRQIEELQRRITLLVAAQKDAALELQREKEAKGKFEKLLATADRLQQESALHMEATKGEMRKEIEAAFRKQVRELEEQLVAARSQQPTRPATQQNDEEWKADAVARLESDIESYRERIKILIRERDEARTAVHARPAEPVPNLEMQELKESLRRSEAACFSLNAELEELRKSSAATGLQSDTAGTSQHVAQLQAELEQTREEARKARLLQTEVESLSGQLRSTEAQLAELATLRQQLDSQSADHANAIQELSSENEARIQELASALENLQAANSAAESLRQEISNLSAESEQARGQLAQARKELDLTRNDLQQRAALLEQNAAEKDARIAELAAALETQTSAASGADTLRGELNQLRADSEQIHAQLAEARQQLEDTRNDLQKRTANLEQNAAEKDARVAELAAALETQTSAASAADTLRVELNELRADSEQTHALLAEARRELEATRNDLQRRASELEETAGEKEARIRELSSTLETQTSAASAAETLRQELELLHADCEQTHTQLAEARKELESTRHELQQRAADIERIAGERDARILELSVELEARTSDLSTADALRLELEKLHADNEQTHRLLEGARKRIDTAQQELQQSAIEFGTELERTAAEKDARIRDLTAALEAQTSVASTADTFRQDLGILRMESEQVAIDLAETRQQLDATRHELQQRADELERTATEKDGRIRELSMALESQSSAAPAAEALQHELAKLRTDNEHTQSLLAEAQQKLDATERDHREKTAALEKTASEKDTRIRELTVALEGLDATAAEHANAAQALALLRSDFDSLVASRDDEQRKFELDRNSLIDERTKSTSELQEQLRNIEQQLQTVLGDRDRLKVENDALATDLRAKVAAHEELVFAFDKEHAAVAEAHQQLARQQAATEDARRELEQLRNMPPDPGLEAENARLRADLDENRQAIGRTQQLLDARIAEIHQHEMSLAAMTADYQKLIASAKEAEHLRTTAEGTLQQRLRELENERDQTAARLAESESRLTLLSGERSQLASSLASLEHQSSDTAGSLARERAQLQATIAQMDQVGAERDMLSSELSASRKQHQQLIASLDEERGALLVARESTARQLAAALSEKTTLETALREAQKALDENRSTELQARQALEEQFQKQTTENAAIHSAALAAVNAELAETRSLLSDLRSTSVRERDSLLGQKSALEQSLAQQAVALEAKIAGLENSHVNALAARQSELEQNFRAELEPHVNRAAQDRAQLDAAAQKVADHERTIATLTLDREKAITSLAAAERNHATALAEAEQRYCEGLAGSARELEQMRLAAETLRAELIVARKMQTEVIAGLDKERDQYAATKADWERNLEGAEEARRAVEARLLEREQNIHFLEEKLQLAGTEREQQLGELGDVRSTLDATRHDHEQAASRTAATERQLRDEIAALALKVEHLVADKQQMAARIEQIEIANRQQLAQSATDTAAFAAERDGLRRELEAERFRREAELAKGLRESEERLRSSAQEVSRIDQELARTRDQRDNIKRERDDLARRVAQITEQQRRMLDDISGSFAQTPPSPPRPSVASTTHTASVIDVTPVPQEESNIHLPRVRPVQIRPPQVKIL